MVTHHDHTETSACLEKLAKNKRRKTVRVSKLAGAYIRKEVQAFLEKEDGLAKDNDNDNCERYEMVNTLHNCICFIITLSLCVDGCLFRESLVYNIL